MKRKRTVFPKIKSFRKELESYVYAYNTILKEKVKTMSVVELLRNSHPSYRNNFAVKANELGMIHKIELNEFLKRD